MRRCELGADREVAVRWALHARPHHAQLLHARSLGSDIPQMTTALAFQAERIRAMTADEKVRVAHALWVQTREVLSSGVRARNPEYSTAQVALRVRELMRDAGT